jgi:histidyl-tRNA synthetase
LIENAPKVSEFYGSNSKNHFNSVLSSLTALKIPYTVNPYLCRGLDYYSHTTFEFKIIDDRLGKSQNTVLAGGRYDSLAAFLNYGESIPAVGWAAGVDRMMLLLDEGAKKPGKKVGVTYISDRDEDIQNVKVGVLRVARELSKN